MTRFEVFHFGILGASDKRNKKFNQFFTGQSFLHVGLSAVVPESQCLLLFDNRFGSKHRIWQRSSKNWRRLQISCGKHAPSNQPAKQISTGIDLHQMIYLICTVFQRTLTQPPQSRQLNKISNSRWMKPWCSGWRDRNANRTITTFMLSYAGYFAEGWWHRTAL